MTLRSLNRELVRLGFDRSEMIYAIERIDAVPDWQDSHWVFATPLLQSGKKMWEVAPPEQSNDLVSHIEVHLMMFTVPRAFLVSFFDLLGELLALRPKKLLFSDHRGERPMTFNEVKSELNLTASLVEEYFGPLGSPPVGILSEQPELLDEFRK